MTFGDTTIETAKCVSTATVTTVLLKKGLRIVWMRGTVSIKPGQPRIAGAAFTLRFVPAREDLATPELATIRLPLGNESGSGKLAIPSPGQPSMTGIDWLTTLRDQIDIGKQRAHDVPLTLARPDVTLEQVRKLFRALDHQAHFVEELANALEESGYEFAIVDAARSLEDLFAELAAAAADKMFQMRR